MVVHAICVIADYQPIYDLVCEVPRGEVASYGMIASLLSGVGPRQVGRALAVLPKTVTAPWHRIVQSSGAIADRVGAAKQIDLLKNEGVAFREGDRVDWSVCRWSGPSQSWIQISPMDFEDVMEIVARWR